ncbi:CPBP family intramembrane glutamic endopeptidase [Bifidobacterium adolescentis]|uniref:CPBP family intramembrane glutamic endopeptidase n=1 Tax=Bifidobacterium adolescentis TaxID=1680 RepID=UPI00356A7F90
MTFPQQPQYPQQPQGRPQGPAPQYQPNGPQSQYPMQPMPQYPQPPIANRNPFFEWLKQARRDFSRIGASLCLMVVVWYALATVLEGALYAAVGGKGETPNWVTYVGSGVPLYLIAMPIAVMLMGKSTVIETRKFDMKPGLFFKLLLMCLPMMWVGSMVGSMLSLALSDGEATNRVADLAMQTNIWNVVFLVILGPIFEEWMFRKQLIDHTRKYGEKTAILLSGLAFGLFHMNLFQFFYAFLLGVMFGYIYMRTSKLRYSTAMHMIINFNGGVLAPWILTRVDLDQLDKVSQAAENGNVAAMEQWASQNAAGLAIMVVYFLLYGAVILAGFVLLIRNFRKAEFYIAPEELPRGTGARTVYGNVGMVTFIVLTVLLTAISLFL